jgi:DNA-binding IclR family transcriptional regulator
MFLLKNARTLLEMADSKLEFRVLRLYACFAQARRPLRLTELVQLLHIPKSSCFALVKGLVTDGYLYEIAPSVGYYPTARMHEHTNAIADEDPVLSSIHSILESLRDTTGETVVVGRVNGNQSVFVAVYESSNNIRLSVMAGARKPLHCNAMGKLFLASMDPATRERVLGKGRLPKLTSRTVQSRSRLLTEIESMRLRGWFSGEGESIEGAMGVALPMHINGQQFALQIGGPEARMKENLDRNLAAMRRACQAIHQLGFRVVAGDATARIEDVALRPAQTRRRASGS